MLTKRFKNKTDEVLKNVPDKIRAKQRGIELLNKFNKEARSNQISNMTLDEINNEIISHRSSKASKYKCSNKNNEDLNKLVSVERTNYNKRIIDEYLLDSRKDRTF